jgi:starch-binding outer membrane protein, SusD/RagB family
MKKLLNLTYLLFGLLVVSSCTSDLNVTPEDDDQFLSDQFFSNDASYKKGLAGVYGNLSLTGTNGATSSNISGVDAGTSQYGRCLWYMQDLSTDEVIWSYENDPGTAEIQRTNWTSGNPIFRGMYGRGMFQVALVNEYLRQTTDEKLNTRGVSDATKAEVKKYRSEVRVLRALAYYHMMDLFGKAAFVTENDPVGDFKGPQYDRQQLFNFIKSELEALENDSNLAAARTNESGRVDKGVAYMILAKMYLNSEAYFGTAAYTECVTYCNKVITAGYQLATNYQHNFMADSNTNSASNEIIFALQSDGKSTQNYGPTTVMCNGGVGSLEGNSGQYGLLTSGWGGALRVRKQFSDKFSDASFNNDDRKTLISTNRNAVISTISDRDSGFVIEKFTNRNSTGGVGVNSAVVDGSTIVDTDFPLFRLGDVYLMLAECHLRGAGGVTASEALDYVNDLRDRANGQTITATELTLDFILDERLRELHWEGHRRQDLIRFGKFTGGSYNWAWKGNGQNGVAIPSYFKVYPLPAESVAANSNLIQNTGY